MRPRAIACIVLALLLSAPASAALISQSRSWNAQLAAPSTIAFDPFDTDLGTLTRVNVVLSGLMTLQALAAPRPDGQGGFLPYSFTILSELDAVSPGGTGFDFGSEARWLTSFTVIGNGQPVVASSAFELAFEFTALSDLTGFAIPDSVSGFTQPPVTIDGRRSDFNENFLNGLIGIQQMFFVPRLPQVNGAPVVVTPTDLRFGGVMRLDYIYEERQAVPEPAVVSLLVAAMAGFVVSRQRQRR